MKVLISTSASMRANYNKVARKFKLDIYSDIENRIVYKPALYSKLPKHTFVHLDLNTGKFEIKNSKYRNADTVAFGDSPDTLERSLSELL